MKFSGKANFHKVWEKLNIIYLAHKVHNIQMTLIIWNTDISKYPFILQNIVWTHFLFYCNFQLLLSQTKDISKLIFFEISVFEMSLNSEISRVDYDVSIKIKKTILNSQRSACYPLYYHQSFQLLRKEFASGANSFFYE